MTSYRRHKVFERLELYMQAA